MSTLLFELKWSEQWRPEGKQYILQDSQVRLQGDYQHASSVHNINHDSVDRIFMGLSWELYCHWESDQVLKQQWTTGRQKGSELHHQDELLHNYYTFESVHDSDQDSVVRIFVGLSFELMFLYSHYITLHNFIPYQECNQQMALLTFEIVLCCLRSRRPWIWFKKLALPDCMISHVFHENAQPSLEIARLVGTFNFTTCPGTSLGIPRYTGRVPDLQHPT